jgi:regulator of replication initiation timing
MTLDQLKQENARLTLENNSLRNLIRSLPETEETKRAREIVGQTRSESFYNNQKR